MKSVLISIQPKWCELIACGKKTVEVRKTKPQQKTPFKVYIYETQGHTRYCNKCQDKGCSAYAPNAACFEGKGKVIGEFVCDKIDKGILRKNSFVDSVNVGYDVTCISIDELEKYLDADDILGEFEFYGWHISDLVIYDKPKELSEFHPPCNHADYCTECKNYDFNTKDCRRITRPPQSWCYVEALA